MTSREALVKIAHDTIDQLQRHIVDTDGTFSDSDYDVIENHLTACNSFLACVYETNDVPSESEVVWCDDSIIAFCRDIHAKGM